MEVDIEPTAGRGASNNLKHHRSSVFLSLEAIQYACSTLASIIHNDVPYNNIRRSFDRIFLLGRNLLSEDQQLRGRLASKGEYHNNIKDFEEDKFERCSKEKELEQFIPPQYITSSIDSDTLMFRSLFKAEPSFENAAERER